METKFKLGDQVRIVASEESGEVVGVSVFAHSEPSALVRYATKGTGEAKETWWSFSALAAVEA